jgi:serine/threonine protein kinase
MEINNYPTITLKNKIGSGAYGNVYKDNNNAIKIIKETTHNMSFINFGPTILTEFTSISILKECKYIPKLNKIYFGIKYGYSMELYDGTIHDVLNKKILSKTDLKKNMNDIIFKITYALAYAQNKMILHRDVKPSNILIKDNYEVGLTDWGLSIIKYANKLESNTRSVQTLWYRSPEHLLQINGMMNSYSMDMWSVGIIMIDIITGSTGTIHGDTKKEILLKLINFFEIPKDGEILKNLKIRGYLLSDVKITIFDLLSTKYNLNSECVEFLKKCLEWYPEDRLTPINALSHPYLNELYKTHEEIEDIDEISKLRKLNDISINKNIINEVNPKYLSIRHLYIMIFHKLTIELKKSGWVDLSIMVKFLDKIMEIFYFTDDINNELLLAIYILIIGFSSELVLYKNDLYESYDRNLINKYINTIIHTFNFPLPIKTYACYEKIMNDNIPLKQLFRNIWWYVLKNNSFIEICTDKIFKKILLIMENYYFVNIDNSEKIMFNTKIENIISKFNDIDITNIDIKYDVKEIILSIGRILLIE